MTAAYRALPPDKIPDATPQLNVLQRVGGAIGIAVVTVVLDHQLRHRPTPAGLAGRFGTTFRWVLAITIAAAIPTIVLAHTVRRVLRRAHASKLEEAVDTGHSPSAHVGGSDHVERSSHRSRAACGSAPCHEHELAARSVGCVA
ncbi:hypothetical protein AB0942_17260 [Streptomyces nodosus]|uniref:hypothetical protein n=1 Tax=Streptomyces nodosus TaxID=40318 RepID=UPI0034511657